MEMSLGKGKQAAMSKLFNKWEETTCIFKGTFDKTHLILCSLEAPSACNFRWKLPPTVSGSMANEEMKCVLVQVALLEFNSIDLLMTHSSI